MSRSKNSLAVFQIACLGSGGIIRSCTRSLPRKVNKQHGSFEGVDILCLPVILIILGLRHFEYS